MKLLTPVSGLVFNALSDGTIHFALYGSSLNHNLIGWNNCNSQSESFVLVVLKAAMERKKKGTIWKSNENWVRNWCQKWHTILFMAANQENKQWPLLIYRCCQGIPRGTLSSRPSHSGQRRALKCHKIGFLLSPSSQVCSNSWSNYVWALSIWFVEKP